MCMSVWVFCPRACLRQSNQIIDTLYNVLLKEGAWSGVFCMDVGDVYLIKEHLSHVDQLWW